MGSTPGTLKQLSKLYGSIIEAGIYEAPNKTAEAAKAIEKWRHQHRFCQ